MDPACRTDIERFRGCKQLQTLSSKCLRCSLVIVSVMAAGSITPWLLLATANPCDAPAYLLRHLKRDIWRLGP